MRTVFITGASSGFGAAAARRFAARGDRIIVAARRTDRLRDLAKELGPDLVLPLSLDIRDRASVERITATLPPDFAEIDILVNNAGLLPPAKQIYKADLDEWQTVMDINLRAPWYLSKLVHPHMKSRGGGAIVNVSSTSGLHHDIGLGVYGISKAGVVMLTEVCAKEWARDGIRVNAIAPGIVKTQLAGSIIEYMQARNMKPNPMNMLGEPEDIAKLVRFLVSDDSRYMTGSIIRIDGGELL